MAIPLAVAAVTLGEALAALTTVIAIKKLIVDHLPKRREARDLAPGIQVINETPHIRKTHKKYDASKFTQKHYDFILECYEEFIAYNKMTSPQNKKTQQDLADVLNRVTGLNKSVTAYARIWRGKVDRETLAVGNQSFTI